MSSLPTEDTAPGKPGVEKKLLLPGFVKQSAFKAGFVAAAFLLSVTLVLLGGYTGPGNDLQVGSIAMRRILSPSDAVNEYATNVLRAQAADKARQNPVYKQDNGVTESVMDKLTLFFDQVEDMRRLYNPIIDPTSSNPEPVPLADLDRTKLILEVSTTSHFTFLITCDSQVFNTFEETVTDITVARLASGIKEDALYGISLAVREELNNIEEWDTQVKNIGNNIITQVLKPNLFVDAESMEKAAQAAADAVSPVYVYKGQNIVMEGAPITEEIFTLLDSLGLVSTGLFDRIPLAVGSVLLVTVVLAAALLFINAAYKEKLSDKKNVVLLFTLYAASMLLAWLLQSMSFVLMPIIVFTMLTAILLDTGMAVGFNLCVTIVSSIICAGDLKFVAFFIITGLFVSVTAKLITERSRMLSVTALISVFSVTVLCAVYLVTDGEFTMEMRDDAVIAALYGMFSVVVCVGVLPLLETLFGFVTSIKLVDLASPNNPLLRRLIFEAPGTYQHSVIVANLAETACYSIGANHALARIGGYYHDVGKLNYPHYFIENMTDGQNPHNNMAPSVSAKVIIEHVTNGVTLANQHRIPKVVRAFIEEHHGQSLQKFFYCKAVEEANAAGDAGTLPSEEDFRYGYSIPQTRESAVVMLADAVEAAVRSVMPGKSMDELHVFISDLVNVSLSDGRLRDSGLTIKDLDTVVDAFIRVFRGMYHERVTYPAAAMAPAAEVEMAAHHAAAAPAEDTADVTGVIAALVAKETPEPPPVAAPTAEKPKAPAKPVFPHIKKKRRKENEAPDK